MQHGASGDHPPATRCTSPYSEEFLKPGEELGLDFVGSHTLGKSPYSFGAHVAVVEVSRDTGATKILK